MNHSFFGPSSQTAHPGSLTPSDQIRANTAGSANGDHDRGVRQRSSKGEGLGRARLLGNLFIGFESFGSFLIFSPHMKGPAIPMRIYIYMPTRIYISGAMYCRTQLEGTC